MFNRFAAKHAHLFEEGCNAFETENKLEYTEVYKEFLGLLEKKVECVIQESGINGETFYQELKKQKGSEDAQIFIEILLSLADYTNFIDMMR